MADYTHDNRRALIFSAGYAALFVAPDEATMHAVQRIFYMHLPTWIAMFLALGVTFVSNIAYLATRSAKWDCLGVAGAEVGVVCCTIGLITGPLWAKPVWGIWWTWDARLTSTFILWLMYIAYLLLRGLVEEPGREGLHFGGVWDIRISGRSAGVSFEPLVADAASAAGDFGRAGSGMDPVMGKVLLLCTVAICWVMVMALVDRYHLESLRNEVDGLRVEAERLQAEPADFTGDVAGKEL